MYTTTKYATQSFKLHGVPFWHIVQLAELLRFFYPRLSPGDTMVDTESLDIKK